MRDDGDDRKPRLYDIFQGEVANIQMYGAFVKIPNCRKQGLVHKSQMSNARIDDPNEMLSRGEKVYCKVISLDNDGDKIALSMKVVNQTTGADQDPNNVQSSQDERKKRKWNFRGNNRIELGAELNTTCRRCNGHGHLTIDCYASKGENSYGLLPDMDELMEKAGEDDERDGHKSHKKRKKNKKEKKKKSKKRKHNSSSSSSSEESDNEDPRKKKKEKDRSPERSGKTYAASSYKEKSQYRDRRDFDYDDRSDQRRRDEDESERYAQVERGRRDSGEPSRRPDSYNQVRHRERGSEMSNNDFKRGGYFERFDDGDRQKARPRQRDEGVDYSRGRDGYRNESVEYPRGREAHRNESVEYPPRVRERPREDNYGYNYNPERKSSFESERESRTFQRDESYYKKGNGGREEPPSHSSGSFKSLRQLDRDDRSPQSPPRQKTGHSVETKHADSRKSQSQSSSYQHNAKGSSSSGSEGEVKTSSNSKTKLSKDKGKTSAKKNKRRYSSDSSSSSSNSD